MYNLLNTDNNIFKKIDIVLRFSLIIIIWNYLYSNPKSIENRLDNIYIWFYLILFDFIIFYWLNKTNSINRLSQIPEIEKFSSIKKILKSLYNWFRFKIIIIIQELFIVNRLFEKKYRENILYSIKIDILIYRELQNIDIYFISNLFNNLVYKNIIYIEYIFYINQI